MEITGKQEITLSQKVNIYDNAYFANDGNNWILVNFNQVFIWKRMCALHIDYSLPTFQTPEEAIVWMIEKEKGKVVTCDYDRISSLFNSLL